MKKNSIEETIKKRGVMLETPVFVSSETFNQLLSKPPKVKQSVIKLFRRIINK